MTIVPEQFNARPLSPWEAEVLRCLFFQGPTEDGNIPSKPGRCGLVELGLAVHARGWAWLTDHGVDLALDLGLDRAKDKWQQDRRRSA